MVHVNVVMFADLFVNRSVFGDDTLLRNGHHPRALRNIAGGHGSLRAKANRIALWRRHGRSCRRRSYRLTLSRRRPQLVRDMTC